MYGQISPADWSPQRYIMTSQSLKKTLGRGSEDPCGIHWILIHIFVLSNINIYYYYIHIFILSICLYDPYFYIIHIFHVKIMMKTVCFTRVLDPPNA